MHDCWEKYVFVATLAAVTCLMRTAVGDIAATERGREIVLEALGVCAATAARNGFPLRTGAHDEAVAALTEPGSTLTACAHLQAREARRARESHGLGQGRTIRVGQHFGEQ